VPSYHIFGSEELSRIAPAVATRVPDAYFALNAEDAAALELTPGTHATLRFGDSTYRLPLVVREALPRGVASLPSGLPELAGIALPAWAEITPEAVP
jgi:NADH-quinone oxidoreductase subunit G